jgi:hypothetical protein
MAGIDYQNGDKTTQITVASAEGSDNNNRRNRVLAELLRGIKLFHCDFKFL